MRMDKESAMDIGLAFLIALVAIAVFIGLFWLFVSRGKAVLRAWAIENAFQIVSFEKKYMFFTGPFKWWTNSRNQIVYFVRVRDRDGKERTGWVRCGSYLGGVFFSNEAEVRWEES